MIDGLPHVYVVHIDEDGENEVREIVATQVFDMTTQVRHILAKRWEIPADQIRVDVFTESASAFATEISKVAAGESGEMRMVRFSYAIKEASQ